MSAGLLEAMAGQVEDAPDRRAIDRLMTALADAGLQRDEGNEIYAMHPGLTGWLRATVLARADADLAECWTRAFVDVMGRLADDEAVRLCASIAHAQGPIVDAPTPTPDLAAALWQEFGAVPEANEPGEGDLARAALRFLAEDSDYRPAIEARLAGRGAEHFAVGEIALTTAVLTILASGIDFEMQRDEQGQVTWRFHYKKPSLKEVANR